MMVMIKDGSCGECDSAEVGKIVTIKLGDENGNFIYKTGKVIEIF